MTPRDQIVSNETCIYYKKHDERRWRIWNSHWNKFEIVSTFTFTEIKHVCTLIGIPVLEADSSPSSCTKGEKFDG
jgi:hypothetical protein